MITQNTKKVWEAVLGDLQMRVTRPSYETWLRDTEGLSHSEGDFVIGAPNTFVAEMLEQRMYSLICQALERVTDSRVDVRFQVLPQEGGAYPADGDGANGPEATIVGGSQSYSDHRDGPHTSNGPTSPSGYQPPLKRAVALNPMYTFDTFIVGKSNDLAHAAADNVSKNPGSVYNPLFLYSDVGLGKTHLLHAIGHRLVAGGRSLVYSTTEEFTNEYIKAIRDGKTEEFRDRYRTADILLLDDIQFLIGKEQTQEGFFHTFNALHMYNRQIVITSDRPVTALTLLEDRVRSRLSGGLVVDIQPPDFETRLTILRAKADAMGNHFAPGILEFIAERIHKNIRELEGNLNRVKAYAQLSHSPITLDLVRTAMADSPQSPDRQRLSDKQILEAVSTYFAIDIDSLKGRRRDKETALARQVAMYLLREEASLGLTAIGRILGGKDHSTVAHACSRISSRMDVDAHLRRDVINIREALATQPH